MVEKRPSSSERPCHSPTAQSCVCKLHASRAHSVGCDECAREVCTRISQRLTNGRGVRPCPTAVGGTADGTRRSTVGTLNMGTWAGTGEALAWYITSDVPSTSPSQGSNSGAHRESYSTHTYAFQRSCPDDSCNTPNFLRVCLDSLQCALSRLHRASAPCRGSVTALRPCLSLIPAVAASELPR